jgi:hypothetical protein
VRAVNKQVGFWRWSWDVSNHPADIKGILARQQVNDGQLGP